MTCQILGRSLGYARATVAFDRSLNEGGQNVPEQGQFLPVGPEYTQLPASAIAHAQ